ncbi:hypothetical protein PPTG_24984 [Phytophthora nicotianae INRA-310]|uniref:Uncharacterized protein n=2 Tax=Phytophthora nicotianae TaxID=4792 RepID=W2P9P8_PHYN3|nr:hypothetical protein PPTG_24984 [Phytophthora nicotianae INRA-310]ETI39248.1 hypothetical protein F443_15154 [Phytophthora nicotianae P1569]ETM97375.1 hypothetical protein PPTG_24984 [Phytophthora nicotianae INRA-310]
MSSAVMVGSSRLRRCNSGSNLERQVAQLQGQLGLLVRMQPYGSHPVAISPSMTLPPAALQPPKALQLPAGPQYSVFSNSGAVLQPPAASQPLAASQPSSDPALALRAHPSRARYSLSKPT